MSEFTDKEILESVKARMKFINIDGHIYLHDVNSRGSVYFIGSDEKSYGFAISDRSLGPERRIVITDTWR